MKKKKIIWLLVSCLMVLVLVITSCGPAAEEEAEVKIEEGEVVIEKGKEEGILLAKTEPPILLSHVSSRMSEVDKRNVKITGLRLKVQAFDSIHSTTFLIIAECGIY